MTYSKSFHADNKTDAILQVEAYFVEVIRMMPEHSKDEDAVMAHMRNLVNLCRDPNYDEEVVINVAGYIVNHTSGVSSVTSSVSVYIVPGQPKVPVSHDVGGALVGDPSAMSMG